MTLHISGSFSLRRCGPRTRVSGVRGVVSSPPAVPTTVVGLVLFAHGLGTMAMCTHRLLGLVGVAGPGQVRRVAVRFASPTPLGGELTVAAYGMTRGTSRSRRPAGMRPSSPTEGWN